MHTAEVVTASVLERVAVLMMMPSVFILNQLMRLLGGVLTG